MQQKTTPCDFTFLAPYEGGTFQTATPGTFQTATGGTFNAPYTGIDVFLLSGFVLKPNLVFGRHCIKLLHLCFLPIDICYLFTMLL